MTEITAGSETLHVITDARKPALIPQESHKEFGPSDFLMHLPSIPQFWVRWHGNGSA